MIYSKELNMEFNSKEELFKQLRKHKDKIIAQKKAEIYKSVDKGISVTARTIDLNKLLIENVKAITIDDNHYYIAVNSTKILDSHGDLHLNGIWDKTVKDQQGKNYLVADHKLELDKTIAKKEYVEIFTAIVPFSAIGKPYNGDTEVLIYKVRKDKIINDVAKEWLDSGDSIEASVRMQYVEILFAADSNDKEDMKFKMNYDKYINEIANKEDFEDDILYFWPVKQAKNIHESSLVLFGSNSSTGLITTESQPTKVTEKDEPLKDTQALEKGLAEILNNLKKIN